MKSKNLAWAAGKARPPIIDRKNRGPPLKKTDLSEPHPTTYLLVENGKKEVFLIMVGHDSQYCGFCGSNTVPPDNKVRS